MSYLYLNVNINNTCLIDYDCSTIASSTLSSPCQDNDEPIIGKSYTGTNNKNSNTKVTSKLSCQEEYSEEFIRQKYGEEKECLKETFDFLKTLAKHLKRGQVVVNTSMIFS